MNVGLNLSTISTNEENAAFVKLSQNIIQLPGFEKSLFQQLVAQSLKQNPQSSSINQVSESQACSENPTMSSVIMWKLPLGLGNSTGNLEDGDESEILVDNKVSITEGFYQDADMQEELLSVDLPPPILQVQANIISAEIKATVVIDGQEAKATVIRANKDSKGIMITAGDEANATAIMAREEGKATVLPSLQNNLPSLQNDLPIKDTVANRKDEPISQDTVKAHDSETNVPKIEAKPSETKEVTIISEKTTEESDEMKKPVESRANDSKQIQAGILDAEVVKAQVKSVEKTDLYKQIGHEILTKLQQKAPMEFKLQLEPENLGQIDIKLKMEEGKLIIDIMAASTKTQALLVSQVDKLVANMGLQNVVVEKVQVHYQNQDSREQASSMNNGMDFFQKEQQERYQGQQTSTLNSTHASGEQNVLYETIISESTNHTRPLRNGFLGMDYTV